MKTVIGLDYGTQAARAVLVDTADGRVICEHSVRYPHGVMEGALASAEDYENALAELLEAVTPERYRENIVGICVDATSLTLVPVSKDGRALALIPEFAEREHAQIKLWKRHEAQPQADEALAKAREMNETFLGRTGGSISSEWMLPKLMETRDCDPEVYENIDIAFDLCEYLTWRLTGRLVRSASSMGYKCLWSRDGGLPSKAYLDALRPGLAEEYYRMLRGEVRGPGQRVGELSAEWCGRLGLRGDVAVASGVLDGHTSLIALGAMAEGDATLVLGTSNVVNVQTAQLREIAGICGIALDGLTPGMYGVDSGQACTGDMLEWYVKNALPADVLQEAEGKGVSPHAVLLGRISEPWNCALTVTDWWNGSRNAPCNLGLRGAVLGMSLDTRPEDIYLAMLQAMVCGTREILDLLDSYGVTAGRILAAGGIAKKNPLLMQEYANFLNRPVAVGQVTEGPALGAAILASVAAGVYADPLEAHAHMGVREFVHYYPDEEHREAYEKLFRRNHALRKLVQEMEQRIQ